MTAQTLDNKTDPVIEDLLRWLKENLPPDADEDIIFRKVRKMQKLFDTLMSLTFEEFYNHAMSIQKRSKDECQQNPSSLEEIICERLEDMKEYVNEYIGLYEERLVKTKKLEASRAKLDLEKKQCQLITSIRLDGCMDLISRYNHLISKK